MSTEPKERRVKVFPVQCHHLVGMLNWAHSGKMPQFVAVPFLRGLPADAQIESLHYDWSRDALMVRVWSESFEVVPDGQYAPCADDFPEMAELCLRLEADGRYTPWNWQPPKGLSDGQEEGNQEDRQESSTQEAGGEVQAPEDPADSEATESG